MLAVLRLLVQTAERLLCQVTCTEVTAKCLLRSGYLYRSNSRMLALALDAWCRRVTRINTDKYRLDGGGGGDSSVVRAPDS